MAMVGILSVFAISIHALTRSATDYHAAVASVRKFQSTHSRGVRRLIPDR